MLDLSATNIRNMKSLLKFFIATILVFLPASAFAFQYIRTPDSATPENPITFVANGNTAGEDFYAECWDGRYQVVVFEGSTTNWGSAGYYFPIRTVTSATTSPFDLMEKGTLNAGTLYTSVAIFFFTDTDTDVPNCDINIFEYSSFTPQAPATITTTNHAGPIGFWKDWQNYGVYSETEINAWLGALNSSSSWLMSEQGYSADTNGMESLINDATKDCNMKTGKLLCAKRKFLAQYMALRLNVLAGRKHLTGVYDLSSFGEAMSYLEISPTNSVTLSTLFSKIESKVSSAPTRGEYLLMSDACNYINNFGVQI